MNSGSTVSSASTEELLHRVPDNTFRPVDSETSLSLPEYTSVTDALVERLHHHQRRDFQEQPYQPEADDWPAALSQIHYPHYHHLRHPHPRFRPPSPDPLRSSLNRELVVSQQHSYPSYHSTTAATPSILSTSTATVTLADSHSSSSSLLSAATASPSLAASQSSSSLAPLCHTTLSPNLGAPGAETLSAVKLEAYSPSVIATAAFENPDHPAAVTVALPSSPSPSPPSSPTQRTPRTLPSYSSHIAARQGSITFSEPHPLTNLTPKLLHDTTDKAESDARPSFNHPDEDSIQPTQILSSPASTTPTAADTHAAMDDLSWQEPNFFFVQATHSYHAADNTFLPLTPLQIIKVTACEESGWWFGQCDGQQGWFPSNHVERVPDGFEAEYSSRPTSITSEDYAEISTGIDGVELQYFGGKLSDNITVSASSDWVSNHLSQPSSPHRRGGDHLAFPSRLSFIAPSSSHPSSPVELQPVHPLDQVHSSTSATKISGEPKPTISSREPRTFTLDDFVTEIGFHLRNLEETIERKDASRYLPLICNMMWCVRTLFMSADVYDRDSTTLATYPEIGKSRRTILLAFGKIYPQCWIANGDRAGYSARDRQLAAEKMGQLGQQIARGVKNFTIRAKKCGLLVNIPGHELRMSDLDFTAFDAKDAMAALGISAKEYGEAAEPVSSGLSVNTLSSGSISASAVSPKSTGSASNIRNRRRVSRANSIKGFKSFNAIRQLRAEHASRYAAAKVSIEHLIADLMECLNDVEGACNLDNLIQHSIQASQMVTIFLASMDEMKAKITPSNSTEQSNNNSSGSNNKDASKQRAELSRTLKDLATFIETLDSRPSRNLQEEHLTIEESLTRLMTLTSNILRCLLDMDIPHRSSSISQDSSLSSDFFAGLPSSGSRGSGDNGRLSVSKSHLQQKNGSTSSINSLKSASTSTKNPAPASSSNARPPTTPACNLMSIGGSKIASLNSLTDLADQQSLDNDPNFGSTIGGGEKDSFMLDPRIAYSEAYGPESLGTGPYRATHDSAVVMLSGESTPHQSLITGPRKAIQTPVVERPVSPMEIEDVIEWTAEVPQPLVERRTDERKALREPSARAATPVIQPSKVSLEAERARVERSPVQKSTKVFGQIETLGEAAAHTDATTAKAFSPASQSSATFPTSSPVVEAKARLEVTEIPPPSMRNQRPRRSNPNTPASPEPSSTSPMIGPQNARRRTPRAPSTEPTLVRPPNSPKESIASASSPNVNKSKDLPKIPSSTAVTYTSIVPVKAETFTIVQEPELVQEYLSVTGLGIQMPQDSSTPSLGTRLPRRPTSPATERASSRPSGIARARSPAPPVPNIGRETVSSRNRRVDNTFSIQSTTSGISSVSTTPSTRLSGSGSMIKLFGSSGLQAPASSRKRNSLVASRTSSDQQQGSGDHPPPPPPKRGSRSTQSDVADREVTAPGTRSSAGKRATPSIRSPSPSSVVQFPAAVRDSHQNKLKQQNTRRDSIQSIQSNLTTASFEMIGGRGDPILASQRASAAKSSRASPGTNSGQYAPSIQSNRSHRLSSDSHHLQHVPQTPPIRPWREPHSQQPSPQLGPSIMRRGISTDDVHPSRPHGLPWFLSHDHSPDEVLFNEENALQAATLEAMIEILTSHRASPDPSYVTTFFATFRLFTTPVELTTMLVSRFQKSPPAGLSEGELHTWKKQKLEIIQRRVQIAFKTWLDGYWFSPKDREAFKLIMDFVTKDMAVVLPVQAGRMQEMLTLWTTKRQSLNFAAQRPASLTKARSYDRVHQLPNDSSPSSSTGTTPSTISSGTSSSISGTSSVRDNSFDRSLKGTRKSLRRGIGLGRDSIYVKSPPAPQVTKTLLNALMKEDSMRLVPVTDIKPLELARQLTLYVNKLFLSIPYLELLDEERPNCPKMIQTANKITAWVTDTIVDEQDVKKRISILKYWIEVCEECVKLNNFDSLTAIVCAIESTPVKRLDITWEGVNKGYRERLVQLHAMISNENNYKKYRAKLKEVQAPCIPFLGLYLTTVMMIKDGNSMYKDPNVKSILPSSRQSHASSRISASSSVSMGGQNAAAAAASSPVPSPSMSAVTTTSSAPKPKLLRYVRFSRLATSVLEFRNFQGQYEYLEVQPLRNYIEHKLNSTDPQDSDRNYRKSYAIEPRYHPPAPPGTALPPPGHYRPMPTSYLSQSSVAGAQSGQQPSSQSTLNRANQHQSMPSQPSSSVQHSRTSSQSSSYLSGGGLATAVFNPHHSHPVPPPLPPKVPTSKANKFSRLWRSGRTYSRQP